MQWDLESAERVWRLALILTGDAGLAERVLVDLARRHADLRAVGESRLDQFVYAWLRAVRTTAVGSAAGGGPVGALRAIELDSRAAWVLARVFGVGEASIARSLRVDEELVRGLVARADASIAAATGRTPAECAAELGVFGDASPPERVVADMERAQRAGVTRRRAVLAAELAVFAVVGAVLVFVVRDLSRWEEDRADEAARAARYSAPMPPAPAESPAPVGGRLE